MAPEVDLGGTEHANLGQARQLPKLVVTHHAGDKDPPAVHLKQMA